MPDILSQTPQMEPVSDDPPAFGLPLRDGDIMMRPSRFITDLPKDLVEVWNVKSGW